MTDYKNWLKKVEFTKDLDGGGRVLAPVFAQYLKDIRVDKCFEWCCGPGWIGLWLLELGICKELVSADINRKAVYHLNKTIKRNGYNAKVYHSDNLKSVPKQKFDIVVSNPPNYVNIQKSHPLGHMREDLRPSDIDWRIHKDFYKDVGRYLKQDSKMYISEVEPYKKEVIIDKEVYDKRKETPIESFRKMTNDNDLNISKVGLYNIDTGNEKIQMGLLEIDTL